MRLERVDITVIVPTRNRPEKLAALIGCLARARCAVSFEVVVVDDGSDPPVRIAPHDLRCRVIRLEGAERSVARNAGAAAARGHLLLFLDDDLTFGPDLLERHWRAFKRWPNALLIGAVDLPDEVRRTPFGRFRARLERLGMPTHRGPSASAEICTAQNLAVARSQFEQLGGFDPGMWSSEDQDLALRHAIGGGSVVFLPDAVVVHHDDALDARSYGARVEWGAAHLGPFLRRHPGLASNVQRNAVNGAIRVGAERPSATIKKVVKALLATDAGTEALFAAAACLERLAPRGRAVQRLYEVVVGVSLFRGHRRRRALEALEHDEDDPAFLRAG